MGSAIRAQQGFESGVGVGGPIRDVENRHYPMSGDEISGAGDDDDGGSTEHLECESAMAESGSDDRSLSDSEIAERSSHRPVPVVERLTPFRYHRDGMIEELADLSLGLDRSHGANEQDWGDVGPTLSDYESLYSLMEKSRAFGVTFLIPRSDQRPWTPPVGYCCVYESFFGDDSKIAVALMFMAAEIDVSMSVRAFEELTQTQPKPNGVYSVQMRSGLHILTSPLIKTKEWKRSYFYVKADEAGFEDPPGVDCRLVIQRLLGLGTLSKGTCQRSSRFAFKSGGASTAKGSVASGNVSLEVLDWASNIPCEEPKGKRLKLPLMMTFSTVYPNYAAILAAQLGNASFSPAANTGETNSVAANMTIDQAPVPASVMNRKKTKSSKKARADHSLDRDEGEVARSPIELRDDDEIEDDRECIRIENSIALEISEFAFPDHFAALTRADAEAASCKNTLVVGYEAALWKATLDLEKAREKIRIKEAELETIARNRISQLEKEKVKVSEKTKRAMERMRQSRNRELLSERNCVVAAADRRFEKFRKYMADRDRKDKKSLLHGTALGTLDAVNMLERKGLHVPGELKDLLITNEETFKKEADEVIVEVITECDLALSPPRSASAVAPRSPYLGGMAFTAAQTSVVAHPSATVVPGNRTNASD
ncbi:hypothetical protein Bca52824_016358 [Brassica carinata]|uniref:Uncharacterized protein n=1 Tax=Brassica carinata TaxID=52824 RepID=A0A8X7W688_BRACI|nr:hypothetical protein Bca52824_016358 [Brassica carinata]